MYLSCTHYTHITHKHTIVIRTIRNFAFSRSPARNVCSVQRTKTNVQATTKLFVWVGVCVCIHSFLHFFLYPNVIYYGMPYPSINSRYTNTIYVYNFVFITIPWVLFSLGMLLLQEFFSEYFFVCLLSTSNFSLHLFSSIWRQKKIKIRFWCVYDFLSSAIFEHRIFSIYLFFFCIVWEKSNWYV